MAEEKDDTTNKTAYTTPTKMAPSDNSNGNAMLASPTVTLPLDEAMDILNSTCGKFPNVEFDPSFGGLLYGLVPDEDYTFTFYNLPVNCNDSYNTVEVSRTIYNYSGSKAPRQGLNKHNPNPRHDLVSFLSVRGECSTALFDSTRTVRMVPLVPISTVLKTPRENLVPEDANITWAKDMMEDWWSILKMNFYKDETKACVAEKLGMTAEWQELIKDMENKEKYKDNWCEKRGKVYTSWKNYEFMKLCGDKMPFRLSNIEGKHFAIVISCMTTCLFIDENNGMIERGNRITYNHLIEKGIIKEGLPEREFIDDIEDMMNGEVTTEFNVEPSISTIYHLREVIPTKEQRHTVPFVMYSAVALSTSIADSKRGSNHSNATDMLASLALSLSNTLTVSRLDERPDFESRVWLPVSTNTTMQTIKDSISNLGTDDEMTVVPGPNFMTTETWKKITINTQGSECEEALTSLFSAKNIHPKCTNPNEVVHPPFLNTFDTLVTDPARMENPTHMLTTSKVNKVYFFVKAMAILYAEKKGLPLSMLEGNTELQELINVGVIYMLNMNFGAGDCKIPKGCIYWHATLLSSQVSYSVDNENHHLLLSAVFVATLFDSALDLDIIHKRKYAKYNSRNFDPNESRRNRMLRMIKKKLHELRVGMTNSGQQCPTPEILNYNFGEILNI